MKWSEEQTVKFINEYIKHECLYNIHCNEYRDKYFRDIALKKISSCMGFQDFSPKDAYEKIRNLKSTYAQEIKKIKKSFNNVSSDGTTYVYVPKVKWFYILHDALLAVNSTEDCVKIANSTETIYLETDETEYVKNEDESQITFEEPTHIIVNENKPQYLRNKPRKRLNREHQRPLKNYDNLMTKVQSVTTSAVKPSEQYEHEFDIFGKSIGAQLKNMPLEKAIEAQMFMQNYLSKLRLQTLRHTYSQRSSSSHSDYDIPQTPGQ